MWLRCPSSPRYHRFITYSLSNILMSPYSSYSAVPKEHFVCVRQVQGCPWLSVMGSFIIPVGVFFTSGDMFLIIIVVRRDEFLSLNAL